MRHSPSLPSVPHSLGWDIDTLSLIQVTTTINISWEGMFMHVIKQKSVLMVMCLIRGLLDDQLPSFDLLLWSHLPYSTTCSQPIWTHWVLQRLTFVTIHLSYTGQQFAIFDPSINATDSWCVQPHTFAAFVVSDKFLGQTCTRLCNQVQSMERAPSCIASEK